MFKKLASYLIPINIHKRNSALSKKLEVTWLNGQLVLDSENTNYSFGSLQRILRRGLKLIGFRQVAKMNQILILGVAGGSVIKTLKDEIGFAGKITGIELDAEVIALADEYFGLRKTPGVEIVIADAFEFVLRTKELYDLVIVDVFQDTKMPGFLFEKHFVNRLYDILTSKGYILFNTMTLTPHDNWRNQQYLQEIDINLFSVQTLPRVEHHNQLIILQKH